MDFLKFPFSPILMQLIPSASHSHSQVWVLFPFSWDYHGIPMGILNPIHMAIFSPNLQVVAEATGGIWAKRMAKFGINFHITWLIDWLIDLLIYTYQTYMLLHVYDSNSNVLPSTCQNAPKLNRNQIKSNLFLPKHITDK